MTRRRVLLTCFIVAAALVAGAIGLSRPISAEKLPQRLSNQEFWKLTADLSEPDGTFHSENLVSNEFRFRYVLPSLVRMAKPGRAYLGVGSEQNFTYMAALHPDIAFIIDIRRGQSGSPPDVQGPVRTVDRPGRLRLAPVLEETPRGSLDDIDRRPDLRGLRKRAVEPACVHAEPPGHYQAARDHPWLRLVGRRQGRHPSTCSARCSSPARTSITRSTAGSGEAEASPTYAELMSADDGAGQTEATWRAKSRSPS